MLQYLFWYGKDKFEEWTTAMMKEYKLAYGRPLCIDNYEQLYVSKVLDYVKDSVPITPMLPRSRNVYLLDDVDINVDVKFAFQASQVPLQVPEVVANPQDGTVGKSDDVVVSNIEEQPQQDKGAAQVEQAVIKVLRPGFSRPSVAIDESDWNLDRLVGRFYPVHTFGWGAEAVNTVLYKLILPGSLNGVNRFLDFILTRFNYYKFNFTVKLDVAGTRFHQGKLLGVWTPLRTDDVNNLCTSTFMDHVEIKACEPIASELSIVHRHPLDFLSAQQNYGAYQVTVMNPLQRAGTASTSLPCVVSVRIDDIEVHAPKANGLVPLRGQSGLADMVGNIPVVGPMLGEIAKNVIPENLSAGEIMSMTSMLLDKPLLQLNNSTYIRRDISNPMHAVGFDNGQRMNLYPSEISTVDENHFGTKTDEMDIGYLISKKCYLNTLTINSVMTPYQRIGFWQITPIQLWSRHNTDARRVELESHVDIDYEVPMITHIANAFNFWRGGLRFYFDFIKTSFHQLKVLVTAYYGSNTPGSDNVEKTQMNHVILAVKDQDSFIVDVPFVYNTPFCNTHTNGIGCMDMVILEGLVSPDGVSNSIEVNVSISACPDFQLNYLTDHPVVESFALEFQSAEIPVSVTGMHPEVKQVSHFSEKYNNIRDILKRFLEINLNTVPSEDGVRITQKRFFVGTIEDLMAASATFKYFTCMYACFRGSFRIKSMPGHLQKLSYQPPHALIGTTGPRDVAHLLRTLDEARSLAIGIGPERVMNAISRATEAPHEIEIPFCSHYNILANRANTANTAGSLGDLLHNNGTLVATSATDYSHPRILVAGGDDLQYGIINYIPKLKERESWRPITFDFNYEGNLDINLRINYMDKQGNLSAHHYRRTLSNGLSSTATSSQVEAAFLNYGFWSTDAQVRTILRFLFDCLEHENSFPLHGYYNGDLGNFTFTPTRQFTISYGGANYVWGVIVGQTGVTPHGTYVSMLDSRPPDGKEDVYYRHYTERSEAPQFH
jgi:hypothetical protein